MNYTEVANVLESVALYVDDIEYDKQASVNAARTERINKLAERYEASTGESVPEQLSKKLANLDPDMLDHLLKVAHNNVDGDTEALGGPAENSDDRVAVTVKEAAHHAEDRFLNWIIE